MARRLVISAQAIAAGDGERCFVEQPGLDDGHATFSSVLTLADCAAIDRWAYETARSWYLSDSGEDVTLRDGTSLGRAFELRATALLVRAMRARVVLEKLLAEGQITTIALRGVGREWTLAAEACGIRVEDRPTAVDLTGGVPDPGLDTPDLKSRALAAVIGLARGAGAPLVTFVGSPRWSDPYRSVVGRRWPTQVVDPGGRALLVTLIRGPKLRPTWLSLQRGEQPKSWEGVPTSTGPFVRQVLGSPFEAALPVLFAAAAAGRTLGGRLIVATQDVSPSIRALLLGFRGSGGRILTLEHGIAGGYDHQIHSVADVLGAWGPAQAAYHRAVGPDGLRVEEVGWSRLEQAYRQRSRDLNVDAAYFGQPAVPLSAASWPEDPVLADAMVDAYSEGHPRRHVRVKVHPATRTYMGSTPGSFARAKVVSDDSLRLISRSRVVITRRSTTALEAMAVGRPVILIDPLGTIGDWDLLAAADGVIHVSDTAGLIDSAERLLRDQDAALRSVEAGRAFVRGFVRGVTIPGSAARALGDLVSSMLD